VIYVAIGLQSQPFLEDFRGTLAFIGACSLLVRSPLRDQFQFTLDWIVLYERPWPASNVDAASGNESRART